MTSSCCGGISLECVDLCSCVFKRHRQRLKELWLLGDVHPFYPFRIRIKPL